MTRKRTSQGKCYAPLSSFIKRTEPISHHGTSYNAHTSTDHSSTFPYHPSTGRKISASPSSRENLDNTISARADDQPAIAAPANIANTFTAHGPVGDDVLRANSLLQRPETYARVVPGGNGFAAVLGEAEGGYGGGVGEHGISALACEVC